MMMAAVMLTIGAVAAAVGGDGYDEGLRGMVTSPDHDRKTTVAAATTDAAGAVSMAAQTRARLAIGQQVLEPRMEEIMQNSTEAMIDSHPSTKKGGASALVRCIDACVECAQVCTACADACLAEPGVDELRRCIRLNLDCADICDATGRVLTRVTEPSGALMRAQLEACAIACAECAIECERHAKKHEHCRVCAESCRRCETACRAMLSAS